LEGIDAAPEDDAPRLAYADWLEQHGDAQKQPHAELIRIQCVAAHSTTTGAADLANREAELLAEIRSGVLGSLAEPAALVDRAMELRRVCPGFAGDMIAALHPPDTQVNAVFRRGFLADLTLDTGLFVLVADELAGIRPRPTITVTGTAAYLRAFLGCKHRGLVSGVHMQTVGDRFRVGFDTRWIRATFGGAELWPRLTTLDLSSCSLGNGDARVVIDSTGLPVLTDLNLARNRLDGHLLRYFTRTPRWWTLRRLSWAGNGCGNDGAEALLAATNDARLECIELDACGIGSEHQQRLVARYGTRVRFVRSSAGS
jgi:uncharacterized protein (TIGR02996 family)